MANKTAVIVVLLILIAIPIGVKVWYETSDSNECTIEVTVRSNHIIKSVDVFVYIDGEYKVKYDGLKPGEGRVWKLKHKLPMFSEVETVEIKATSQGGGLGSTWSSDSLTVSKGGYYRITLFV